MLVGSTFGDTREDPGGGFIKFAVKRALKQDKILHMEGELPSYSLVQGGVPYIDGFLCHRAAVHVPT